MKLTQVAPYKPLILEAKTQRKTFHSTPAAVTAGIVWGSRRSRQLPTGSLLWRESCWTAARDGGSVLVAGFGRSGER